jgi:hypothetical protein
LLILFLSCSGFSYTVRGNGGFLVMCQSGKVDINGKPIISVEVLDIFEGNKKYKRSVKYSIRTEVFAKVQEYIERAEKLQMIDSNKINPIFEHLKNNLVLRNLSFAKIDDLGSVQSSKCSLVLGGLQKTAKNTADYTFLKYNLDNYLWQNHLSEDQKAVLLFHELLYTNYMLEKSDAFYLDITSEEVRALVYTVLTSHVPH